MSAPPLRCLVTGAAGFVGGHVRAHLQAQGVRVRGLGRGDPTTPGEWARVADLADREGLRAALRGVDALVHCAARVHVVRESHSSPLAEFRRVNVEGTRVLLEEAAAAGVRLAVLVSSVAAVGTPPGGRVDDATPAEPETPYGRSKLEAEEVLAELCERSGMQGLALRPPGVYGPGMKGNIPRLFGLIARGVPVPVPATPNRRSLIYVGSLTDAVVHWLSHPTEGCSTHLIADPDPLSSRELVRTVAAAMGRPGWTIPVPAPLILSLGAVAGIAGRLLSRPVHPAAARRLIESLEVDDSGFRAATGFTPSRTARQGLAETARWYLERRGETW